MSQDFYEILMNSVLTCKHRGVNGDWRIDNKNAKLRLREIAHLVSESEIYTLDHNDIAWVSHRRTGTGDRRYDQCDVLCPGIVAKDAPNPYGKKYRLLDGAHRMSKMIDMGITRSRFHVIEFAMVRPFFTFFKEKPNDPI